MCIALSSKAIARLELELPLMGGLSDPNRDDDHAEWLPDVKWLYMAGVTRDESLCPGDGG